MNNPTSNFAALLCLLSSSPVHSISFAFSVPSPNSVLNQGQVHGSRQPFATMESLK